MAVMAGSFRVIQVLTRSPKLVKQTLAYSSNQSATETSCLNKTLVLKCFYGLKREKIIKYDFCQHQEYLVPVSHNVKSFQKTGSFATGSLIALYL